MVLERDVPLSQSLVWRQLREFYARRALKAWTEDGIPQYLTNNPFIAELYARIVFGFISDCSKFRERPARPCSPQNPLRILELGAGSGKFSYLFLRHLTALLTANDMARETVRYCMTDCSEGLLESWRTNSYLREFVGDGILQFASLPAGSRPRAGFLGRGDSINETPTSGPLVAIANYVFDSLPQDAFATKDGQLFEALVTTTTDRASVGDSAGEALSGLKLSYKNVLVPSDRYAERTWNAILEVYRSTLPEATVLLPTTALDTLEELGKSADGGLLVLAGDKGYAHEEQLSACQGPPTMELHAPNCFSQMVNFDAIARYFRLAGGTALLPDKQSSNLSICAFLQGRPGQAFSAATKAYFEAQAGFGPDDLFALLSWLNPHMEEVSLSQALALLRLSRWDPVLLLRLFPVISRQLRSASVERSDLRDSVMRTWVNHYPVNSAENVLASYCGAILLELKYFDEALSVFRTSQQILGRSAAASYNQGLCLAGLGRSSEALVAMSEACELDPGFAAARVARSELASAKNQ